MQCKFSEHPCIIKINEFVAKEEKCSFHSVDNEICMLNITKLNSLKLKFKENIDVCSIIPDNKRNDRKCL